MTQHAEIPFDVTGWEQSAYDEDVPGARLYRATVRKTFRGALEGESMAQLLMCMASPDDYHAGAGYLASERVTGRLGGRAGSFVIQHWGLSGAGQTPSTAGHVVPGTGTGELAGLTGTLEIRVEGKAHTLILDYDLG
jgi:hypothetical protein